MSDKKQWQDKIANISQVGGIETSVLDNGSGRGTRIAWVNTGSGLRFKILIDLKFKTKQLPHLTNWQHWGLREYVTALEPGTNPPMGQKQARETNTLDFIEPGDTRMYDLELEVMDDNQKIQSCTVKMI